MIWVSAGGDQINIASLHRYCIDADPSSSLPMRSCCRDRDCTNPVALHMFGGALKRFQLFHCSSQAPAGTRTYPKPSRSSLCRRDKYSTAQPRCIAGEIHPHPESPASLRTGAVPGLECGAEEPIWGFCRGAAVPVTLQPWLPMLQLCQVTSSLFISNAKAACNEDLLTREGVTFCVNVTRQQPFPSLQQVRGIRVPVFDDPAEDLYRYFEQCSDAIEEAVKSGGKCLVYCKNGRSRSAAICTAYLMRHQKLPLKDAFETVKAARPVAEPNSGFWSQLQRYEEDLQIPKQSDQLSKQLKNSNV